MRIDIAGFFSSCSMSMATAISEAAPAITGIINLIDTPMKPKTRVGLDAALTVLGFALSFIPIVGPEAAGLTVLGAAAINLVTSGIKQLPDAAKTLWPAGTVDTTFYQIDQLTQEFPGGGGISTQLALNFQYALETVQGLNQPDTSSFLLFTGQGQLSNKRGSNPNVQASSPEQQAALRQFLITFLVSTALSQNNWQILLIPGADALGLYNGTAGCPGWASDCDSGKESNTDIGYHSLDTYNQCDNTYLWYSETYGALESWRLWLIHIGIKAPIHSSIIKRLMEPGQTSSTRSS